MGFKTVNRANQPVLRVAGRTPGDDVEKLGQRFDAPLPPDRKPDLQFRFTPIGFVAYLCRLFRQCCDRIFPPEDESSGESAALPEHAHTTFYLSETSECLMDYLGCFQTTSGSI